MRVFTQGRPSRDTLRGALRPEIGGLEQLLGSAGTPPCAVTVSSYRNRDRGAGQNVGLRATPIGRPRLYPSRGA